MRFIVLILCSLLSVSPAFANCESGEAAIKIGTPEEADSGPRQLYTKSLQQAADAAFQGNACVEVVKSTELYNDDEALGALQSGAIQIAVVPHEKLALFSPKLLVFSLPFAFRDTLALNRFLSTGAYTDLLKPLEANGLTPLAPLHEGFNQLAGSKPVLTPADAAGMRFRRAGAPDIASRPDLLRASARAVKDSDVVKEVAEKRIEAITGSWTFLAANKLDIALDGVTETNHRYSGWIVVASKPWFEALEDERRKRLSKAVADVARATNAATLAAQAAAMRTIMRRDRPVRALTNAQRAAWLERLKPMWARFADDEKLMTAIGQASAMP